MTLSSINQVYSETNSQPDGSRISVMYSNIRILTEQESKQFGSFDAKYVCRRSYPESCSVNLTSNLEDVVGHGLQILSRSSC